METEPTHIDYIIVGQGIAGSTLAFRMIEAGLKVRVIDVPKENSGSRVAAGIVNPVTGRKMVKSWMIDELLLEVEALYQQMEARLGISCLHPIPVYKLFSTIKDQNDWMLKREDDAYEPYLSEVFYPSWYGVETPHGAGIIKNAFWLDIRQLIKSMNKYLIAEDLYLSERFDFDALDVSKPDEVRYKQWCSKGIVFCDGHEGRENPFFRHLPLSFAKGEIMIIECPELSYLDGIFNKNGFIIPLGEGRFKVGATFQWHDTDPQPSEKGRKAILKKFSNMCSLAFEELVRPFSGTIQILNLLRRGEKLF